MLDARELKLALQFLGMHLSNRQAGLVLKHLASTAMGSCRFHLMQLVWDGKLERLRKKFHRVDRRRGRAATVPAVRCDNDGKLSFEEFRGRRARTWA